MQKKAKLSGSLKNNPLLFYTALFCAGSAVGVYMICSDQSSLATVQYGELIFPDFVSAFVRAFVNYVALSASLLLCANLTFGWMCSAVVVCIAGLWHSAGCSGALIACSESTKLVICVIAAFIIRSVGLAVVILSAVECTAISCAVFFRAFAIKAPEKFEHIKKRYFRVMVYSVSLTAAAATEAAVGALLFRVLR